MAPIFLILASLMAFGCAGEVRPGKRGESTGSSPEPPCTVSLGEWHVTYTTREGDCGDLPSADFQEERGAMDCTSAPPGCRCEWDSDNCQKETTCRYTKDGKDVYIDRVVWRVTPASAGGTQDIQISEDGHVICEGGYNIAIEWQAE